MAFGVIIIGDEILSGRRVDKHLQKVIQLLSAYLDVKQEAVRVVIGLDEALPSMGNFVLIGAPAHSGNEVMGSLAVIGPTRMDYQHTITAVSYIARLFDKILNESE